MPPVLPVEVAPLDRDLDVRPLAFPEVADRVVVVLRTRQEYAVVARTVIVAAVVDVGVQPVLVDAPVEQGQAHLLR
jgi:hypothetical protein